MHPSLRILLYPISALALPGLNFFTLAAVLLALPLFIRNRAAAMLRLAWRARWLFLLLGIGYAYGLPGPSVWEGLGDWAPSTNGVRAAGMHMMRLLALLWLLDSLVVSMGTERMMAGLHGVFSGLSWLGFPAERTTVRLGLTLQAMERNTMKLRDLSTMLADTGTLAVEGPAVIELAHELWRPRDTAILLMALTALTLVWLA